MSCSLFRELGRLLYRLLLLIIVLGYAILWYYNYKGYLTLNQFIPVTLIALMSISTLLLLSRSARYEVALPGINLGKRIRLAMHFVLLRFL